jgi:hypothetical protein
MLPSGFFCPEHGWGYLSIDESMHANDLFTFVSNKDGHGKRGTLIAAVRGTKAEEVSKQLLQIPQEQRNAVKEVTMDFSDSMYTIVKAAFPNAIIVIDCFHIVKRLCDGFDEMRMRFKRQAVSENKKNEREFNRKKAQRAKARAYYRKKHPGKRGEKRGRPGKCANRKYVPMTLSNGDTQVELFTRARYILPKSGDKWSESQKKRADILFELKPRIKQAYSIVCQLRCTLLFQDQRPSWLFEVDNGSTSIWENWNSEDEKGKKLKISHNHYAFGCVADWIYRKIGGITRTGIAYDSVLIMPELDDRITWAKRTFISPKGLIACEWKRVSDKFSLRTEIPSGVVAKVVLPNSESVEASGGVFCYECPVKPVVPEIIAHELKNKNYALEKVGTVRRP